MKKTLIAGAASLAVAAMPVAGTFAVVTGSPVTDNLEVTIAGSCSIEANRVDGGAEWSDATLSKGMTAGTYDASFGSTDFTIKCNNTDGWKVSAVAAENLTSENGDKLPLLFSAINGATKSGYTVTTSTADSTVTAKGIMTKASDDVATSGKPTVNAGAKFTASYAVAVADGQAAGTYEGSVVYTLAEL